MEKARSPEIDSDTLKRLGEHLSRSVSFEAGPRVGRLLPQAFRSAGCDHTLEKTTAWLAANGRDADADIRWLKERGGTCDCKVITNVIWQLDREY